MTENILLQVCTLLCITVYTVVAAEDLQQSNVTCNGKRLRHLDKIQKIFEQCRPKKGMCGFVCTYKKGGVLTDDLRLSEDGGRKYALVFVDSASLLNRLVSGTKKCGKKLNSKDKTPNCTGNLPFINCMTALYSQECKFDAEAVFSGQYSTSNSTSKRKRSKSKFRIKSKVM